MKYTISMLSSVSSGGTTMMPRWYAEHLEWLEGSLLDMHILAKGRVQSCLTKSAVMVPRRA